MNPAATRPWAYICSPFRADTPEQQARHVAWARQMARQAWDDGYWPIVPHLYAPQFLDDADPVERAWGLQWGLDLLDRCVVMYVWAGGPPSAGMAAEIASAQQQGLPVRPWIPTEGGLPDVSTGNNDDAAIG
ncbi:hypothetical protein Sulac_0658 [Sulfobacillus acidophilus DSM 10332]|uniref:DUF7768 domain-containing protein n=1 Tax=Sulfobacillus acidophilus (strain ATCC 700253 / DSM 10332 / NAL) TaxID=679936 RepID=G8U002_SULAD|nr:hypothetical protein Sulac_0658 [Sulfobacillus acidophilus DSM 10332]